MNLRGQFRTVWPVVRHSLLPYEAPEGEAWTTRVADDSIGAVQLTGLLTRADPDRLVMLVHGLGGCSQSAYQVRAASRAAALGLSCLRFEMRGSDRGGADLYHAGLSSDLGAALASPELADFEHLYILGFSLGGHLALHYATGVGVDPRLRAVAAVCAPLDLEACVDDFDQPNRWLYRRRILSALKDLYRPVARRREMPVPVERVEAIRGIREWDELTVVPRFGFRDTADYYARAGVASRLGRLRVPALLIAAEDDPMVTARAVRSGLAVTSRHDLRVEWAAKSGHIGFPPGLDLGLGGEPGLENQALHWLLEESHT